MAALGVPTTRALALATCNDVVARDQFYNGNVQVRTLLTGRYTAGASPYMLSPYACLAMIVGTSIAVHLQWEPCAIVTRLAPSFLRIGSLEIQTMNGCMGILEGLVDYALELQDAMGVVNGEGIECAEGSSSEEAEAATGRPQQEEREAK